MGRFIWIRANARFASHNNFRLFAARLRGKPSAIAAATLSIAGLPEHQGLSYAMNQQSAVHALRVWCRMDAAFGAAELPLPADVLKASADARRIPVAAPSAAPRRDAGEPAADVRNFAQRQAPSVRSPVAASPESSMPRRPGSSAPTASNPADHAASNAIPQVAVLPSIPDGKITDLPALSAAEKARQLAALEAEACAGLAPYVSQSATRVVFGEGDSNAGMMFIGEGPGTDEDRLGRPFVGRSGQLLDKMIVAIGLTREKVYIANIVKLRSADWDPVGSRFKDRPPSVSEAALGIPWLHRQIEIIRPRVLVTLGASAVRHLLGVTGNLSALRGHWQDYRGIPVMPTYHPAFLLRAYTEENRRLVWNDLKAALGKI